MEIARGLTLRKGKQEVNVHEVRDGIVYFGTYDNEANEAPEHCTGLYQAPLEEFKTCVEGALSNGAEVVCRPCERMKA